MTPSLRRRDIYGSPDTKSYETAWNSATLPGPSQRTQRSLGELLSRVGNGKNKIIHLKEPCGSASKSQRLAVAAGGVCLSVCLSAWPGATAPRTLTWRRG